MRRDWLSGKVLAAILSASLFMSPTVTAMASSAKGASDNASTSSTTEDSSATVESSESEESDKDKSSNDSSQESSKKDENAIFEEVDPKEEGLSDPKKSLEGETPDTPVEEPDPNEKTRVIIVMEGDSVLDKGYDTEDLADNKKAMALSEKIEEKQEEKIEEISKEALNGKDLDVSYNFTLLTNAVSADVKFKDIAKIEKVDGVEAVYIAPKYEPLKTKADKKTITAGEMIGSYDTWETGYTGAGTRIAVIDTGIDSDHPSFDGDAFEAHLEETAKNAGKKVSDYNLLNEKEIDTVLPSLNATSRDKDVDAKSLYVSEKIPFAFNYVDKNLDITHDNDSEGDHGTHVSGISTANAYVPNKASKTGFSKQETGVVGVAPDAQLITMKVFGTNGGAYSDDYMAAIEDALLLKADVINLSLGSSAAGYSSDSESYINEIFAKLEGTSTVVSISAGNSGRWSDDSTFGVNLSKDVNQDTVGSPGSYTNAFTVASAVNSGFTGNFFTVDGGKPLFYSDANETLAPAFKTLDTSSDKNGTEYPYVFLDAKGEEADYEGVDVKDKIVFVQRGAITFGQKQMNAEAAGAKAVVIYNNAPGTISMTMQGSTAKIPAVSITLADGLAIKNNAKKVSDTVYEGKMVVASKVTTNHEAADGYTMSTFSSYGVPGSLDLKPEITAPGGNIYSTRDKGTYGLMSGTSMAAPSIAGQSALVEQYIRENRLDKKTGLSVRTLAQSLLMSTATPLKEGNVANGLEFSPRSQGAGLANVYDAVTSPAYILVGDKDGNDGKVKAVLGDDPSKNGDYKFSFDVYNLSDEAQYYVLDSSVLTEELHESGATTYFAGESHKLSPEVTLTANHTALLYDLNNDKTVDKADKTELLKVVNGSKKDARVAENEDYFDFNEDGIVDTKDVYTFGKELNGKDSVVDLGKEVVEVKNSTKIDVEVKLSESDKKYLSGFENGMYVDGFVYVKGNTTLSVPFLAFYGSWMDSSMFENFDFQKYVHDADYSKKAQTYCGIEKTNFLSVYPFGENEENYYIPNMFAEDEKYVEDRNAISSLNGTAIGSYYYSLIRNASRVIATIKNHETGEVYFTDTKEENYAEFSYNGTWKNYIQHQDYLWLPKDKKGKALADGTKIDIVLEAVPSYYNDVKDPSTLKGKGLYLKTSMTVDNTKPLMTDAEKDKDGNYNLTVYDNRYTAAVILLGSDKKTIIGRYAINQEKADEDMTIKVEAPEDVFYVEVFDYAYNASVYRVNNTGHADTKFVTDITVDKEEVELEVGKSATVKALVSPKWLAEGYNEVEWESEDTDVATVTQSGTIRALKAGETKVVVTTLATNKKGKHLTAEVKVIVKDKTKKNDATDAASEASTNKSDEAESSASTEETSSNEASSEVSEEDNSNTESSNKEENVDDESKNATSDSAASDAATTND